MKDSPQTPTTPDSPGDISKSAKLLGRGSSLLQDPAIKPEGYWRTKQNHGPHRDVLAFKPASAEEAKAFLSQISLQLTPRLLKFTGDTPNSSRTVKWPGRTAGMPCHSCHGPIGGGAHSGSAPGKNICSHDHHPSCPGGVVEDDSYKACPVGYVYQQVLTESGFEQTMHSQDFVATQTEPTSQQLSGISPIGPQVSQSGSHMAPQIFAGSLQSVHNTPDQVLGSSQHTHHISEEMQRQMDFHRAANQAQSVNQDRPVADDLNIRDLES